MTIKEVTAYTTNDCGWDITTNRNALVENARRDILNKYLYSNSSDALYLGWYSTQGMWRKQKLAYEKGHTSGYKDGHSDGISTAQRNFIKFYDQIMAELKEIK